MAQYTHLVATGFVPAGFSFGRHAWAQVARGRVRVNGHDLSAGDGAALSDVEAVQVEGVDAGEVLVFDLG